MNSMAMQERKQDGLDVEQLIKQTKTIYFNERLPKPFEMGVDDMILPLMDKINSHPLLATTVSCAGHYRRCPVWRPYRCHQRAKAYANGIAWCDLDMVSGTAAECISELSPLCSWSAPPYVCLIVHPSAISFVTWLQELPPRLREVGCTVEFCPEESLLSYRYAESDGSKWSLSIFDHRQMFELFWKHLAESFDRLERQEDSKMETFETASTMVLSKTRHPVNATIENLCTHNFTIQDSNNQRTPGARAKARTLNTRTVQTNPNFPRPKDALSGTVPTRFPPLHDHTCNKCDTQFLSTFKPRISDYWKES